MPVLVHSYTSCIATLRSHQETPVNGTRRHCPMQFLCEMFLRNSDPSSLLPFLTSSFPVITGSEMTRGSLSPVDIRGKCETYGV